MEKVRHVLFLQILHFHLNYSSPSVARSSYKQTVGKRHNRLPFKTMSKSNIFMSFERSSNSYLTITLSRQICYIGRNFNLMFELICVAAAVIRPVCYLLNTVFNYCMCVYQMRYFLKGRIKILLTSISVCLLIRFSANCYQTLTIFPVFA